MTFSFLCRFPADSFLWMPEVISVFQSIRELTRP
jgi:hypothetical protein